MPFGPIARAPPVQVYCPAVMHIQGANPITPLQFDNLRCESYCPFPDARQACRCESIAPFEFDPSPVRVYCPLRGWKTLVFLRKYWFFDALRLENIGFPEEILVFRNPEAGKPWFSLGNIGFFGVLRLENFGFP